MMSLASSVVGFIFGVIEVLLVVRFFFRFIGASAQADIVAWVYRNSDPFVQPFVGILSNWNIGERFVLEWSTLFAIVAFALLGVIIERLLQMIQA